MIGLSVARLCSTVTEVWFVKLALVVATCATVIFVSCEPSPWNAEADIEPLALNEPVNIPSWSRVISCLTVSPTAEPDFLRNTVPSFTFPYW